MESWWALIKGPEHLKEITDGDIQSVWYVQALKAMTEAESEHGEEEDQRDQGVEQQ